MEFNCEQSYVYLHSQGLTNMWKAFPSPLMVNEYHDKYQYCDMDFFFIVIAYFYKLFWNIFLD